LGRVHDEEHALYRRLFERQSKLVPRYACPEWIDAIAGLEPRRKFPFRFGFEAL
jgi:phenylalanine-4-hydroxylase